MLVEHGQSPESSADLLAMKVPRPPLGTVLVISERALPKIGHAANAVKVGRVVGLEATSAHPRQEKHWSLDWSLAQISSWVPAAVAHPLAEGCGVSWPTGSSAPVHPWLHRSSHDGDDGTVQP